MAASVSASKSWILAFVALVVAALLFLSLRPLPKATVRNCTAHRGIVDRVVQEGGPGDIVIRLRGDKRVYYINRGVEAGLSVADLGKALLHQPAEILTINHWTPLDPGTTSRHIAQVRAQNKVLYSEIHTHTAGQ